MTQFTTVVVSCFVALIPVKVVLGNVVGSKGEKGLSDPPARLSLNDWVKQILKLHNNDKERKWHSGGMVSMLSWGLWVESQPKFAFGEGSDFAEKDCKNRPEIESCCQREIIR